MGRMTRAVAPDWLKGISKDAKSDYGFWAVTGFSALTTGNQAGSSKISG